LIDNAKPKFAATFYSMMSCAKLHFLTGSQKNIFYQMTSGDFSIKKPAIFGRLAIISNERHGFHRQG